uniref:Si:dkey-4p15.5 n=1 Tax=Myripristis murdjan TaxID=586833 RepID=A0A667XDU5_9TELE
ATRNSDINVTCGTDHMQMTIYLCPVYHANYNESLMAMNGVFDKPECFGVPDWNADPPLLTFNFSITEQETEFLFLQVTNEVGTGIFADFSNVQHVNISGTLNSLDPSAGTITYRPQVMYMFSCKYPMQYVVNNTELGVLAIKDNNGTFISTLSMHLYGDSDYTEALFVPESGLNLKTKIFVAVKATNLTDKFHVLLDRCYATTLPFPTNSTYYDLFVGCTRDPQTVMEMNGEDQKAHFSFEAFRFVSHKNMTVSTFYLHCITRLCEVSRCATLKPVSGKKPCPKLFFLIKKKKKSMSHFIHKVGSLAWPNFNTGILEINMLDENFNTITMAWMQFMPTAL